MQDKFEKLKLQKWEKLKIIQIRSKLQKKENKNLINPENLNKMTKNLEI